MRTSYGTAYTRLQRGIHAIKGAPLEPFLWPQGLELVLIADALWLRIGGQQVTVYVILLRGTDSTFASPVVFFPQFGHESEAGWRATLERLPAYIREHVVGATTDGHSGLHRALWDLCGAPGYLVRFQWCQFHFLADFRTRLGQIAIATDPFTRLAWTITKRALREPSAAIREVHLELVTLIAHSKACPQKTQRALAWFAKVVHKTLAAYKHQELGMPLTTGTAEAVCKRLRALLERIRARSIERVTLACWMLLHRNKVIRCRSCRDKWSLSHSSSR